VTGAGDRCGWPTPTLILILKLILSLSRPLILSLILSLSLSLSLILVAHIPNVPADRWRRESLKRSGLIRLGLWDKLLIRGVFVQTLPQSATIPLHPRRRSGSEAEMIEELIQIAETQVTRIHQLRGYL